MGIRRCTIYLTRSEEGAPEAADVIQLLASDTGSMVYVHDPVWTKSEHHDVLEFLAVGKHLGTIFRKLESEYKIGAEGTKHSRIAVCDLTATKPMLERREHAKARAMQKVLGKKCKKFSMKDSMTVEEMFTFIDEGSHLTCDYLGMVFVGAMIAGVGLLQDSSVTVVASMLVSPLMGPIVSVTFGIAICEWPMVLHGLRNEAFGVALCVAIGAVIGLVVAPLYTHFPDVMGPLDQAEIVGRGTWKALVSGAFVAAPSGVGVALGVSGGGINALVGVAISAALLPPVVNCGMCGMISLYKFAAQSGEATPVSEPSAAKLLEYSIYSLFLFVMNLALIILFGLITFAWCKDVTRECVFLFSPSATASEVVAALDLQSHREALFRASLPSLPCRYHHTKCGAMRQTLMLDNDDADAIGDGRVNEMKGSVSAGGASIQACGAASALEGGAVPGQERVVARPSITATPIRTQNSGV